MVLTVVLIVCIYFILAFLNGYYVEDQAWVLVNYLIMTITMLVVLAFAFSKPAQASETCEFNYTAPSLSESMCWPVDTEQVVIESEYKSVWGMRQHAKWLDYRLEIDLIFGRYARCESYPNATCIRVEKEPLEVYTGYATFDYLRTPNQRLIVLDTELQGYPEYREYRRFVSLHELIHALGMSHFDGFGLMGMDGYSSTLTEPELDLLQQTYN